MKTNLLKIVLVLLTCTFSNVTAFAQSPNGISYQAVVRNSSDDLATNTNIGMQISILQGSAGGTAVYVERHFPTTNANGLVSFEIGSGTIISGNFEVIDWENGPYFIKTETDLNGGSNYTITGTSEFLSVPYALHSKTAETVSGGISENDPVFSAWDKDYNDLINTPSIPVIPENVSEFTNDAGYLTEYTEVDPEFSAWDKDYNDLINTPSIPVIPENVSDFTNDAGYLTEYTELDPEFSAWDKDYNDLINTPAIPVIPENVSEFTNDAGYLTEYTELDPEFSANFDFSDATVGDLLQFDGTKWVKVTPDYISDYTVTESDVTAHEGALQITESQIVDLQTYLLSETDPTWNGTADETGTISRTGSVGIGTNTPTDAKLQLEGSGLFDAVLRLQNTGTSGANVFFAASNSSWSIGGNKLGIGLGIPASTNVKLTIQGDGNVGIGTTTPAALLHTNGVGTGEGNILFVGSFKGINAGNPPASGPGTRMMWYPDKAAFRVGHVYGTQWDKDSIGYYSFASGRDTKAKGENSTAMGTGTTASGTYSIAMGTNTTASGMQSTAMGSGTTASGTYSIAMGYVTNASGGYSTAMGASTTASGSQSTAMGYGTTASGFSSTAMGNYTTASGYYSTAMGAYTNASGISSTAMGGYTTAPSGYETVIGSYNTIYTPASTNGWNTADRLFVIGNGTGSATTSDAMVVLKNGNVGIGTSTPAYQLQLSLNSAAKPTTNTWTVASDRNLKTNIHPYESGLQDIMKIEPVWFTYTGEAGMPQETGVGVIAQDLQKVAPYMVTDWVYRTNEGKETSYLGVDNGAMTYMLINGIKEQQQIIELQQNEIELQKNEIELQKNEIETLKKMYDDLMQRVIAIENN